MHQRYRLLRLMADGRFHSGEALGAALGIGRSAVWKLVRSLERLGMEVCALRGKGYRLAYPIDLLERARVLEFVNEEQRGLLSGLDIHASLESTNRFLMERTDKGLSSGFVCLAEHQSSGRGRRGRSWISPFGANLSLSIYWRFDIAGQALSGLSLAAGVAVARVLSAEGVAGIGLKWPNDVLWDRRKLAGILMEISGESTGACNVVVGVGLNVNMPPKAGETIDQPWVDLRTVTGQTYDRNVLAGRLIQELITVFTEFASRGLNERLLADWERFDVVRDRPISLLTGQGEVTGTAVGLDETGALLVSVDGKTQRFFSGEVSLRF